MEARILDRLSLKIRAGRSFTPATTKSMGKEVQEGGERVEAEVENVDMGEAEAARGTRVDEGH
jgi:hypothetical protein